jgi:hypothetical protein
MERASHPGAPMSAWLPAMTELAKAMAEPASGLRDACTRFAGQMVEMDAAVQAAFDVIAVRPPEQRAGSPTDFLEQMVSTAESTHEVIGVLGEVEVGMRWLVKMSRELRVPGRDISAAVKQVSGVMTRVADWERRARELI